MPVVIDLDIGSGNKEVSVSELAAAIDITAVSVSVLQNGRVKAVRFAALGDVCRVLASQPGDILRCVPDSVDTRADRYS